MKHTNKVLCLLAAIFFALSATSCSFTTAKVTSAVLTDENGSQVDSYSTGDTIFYAQATVSNAPEKTKISVVWTFVTDNQTIDQAEYYTKESSEIVPATLETTDQFPAGDYKVEFYVEDKTDPDATVIFSVIPAPSASIEDAHMTSYMDEGGEPVDTITIVEPTGTWYVSGILRNTQPDTTIRFVWLDTTGAVIDEYIFDPQGQADIYVGGTLQLSQVAPSGTYRVELYLDDKTEPETTVSFEVKDVDLERNEAENADYSVYVQTEGGFMINYPTAWTCAPFPDSLAAMFYPEEYVIDGENEVNAVSVYKILDLGYSTQEALDGWILATENENRENYESLHSSIEQVNDRDTGLFIYAWSRNGYDLVTSDFLIVDGEDLYIISSVATDEVLEDMYRYAEQMVLSFVIL